ncbi:hypothetical protein B484DRAFT_418531 [Ochromonadaceae sp. CCMP2298]|nr:hypothetical protein B484DRAFT_418531 [Ochromonadaceae sp. CCMP2298]
MGAGAGAGVGGVGAGAGAGMGAGMGAETDTDTGTGVYCEVVYSTLQGHLIAGEEAFRVRMGPGPRFESAGSQKKSKGFLGFMSKGPQNGVGNGNGGNGFGGDVGFEDEVVFEVISYSRGCGFLGTLAMPLVRGMQGKFLREHCDAMLLLMGE